MLPTATKRFVRSPTVVPKPVGGTLAVYVPARRSIHVLNPTARILFEALSHPVSESELIEALLEATDGARRVVASDVTAALEEFLSKQIAVVAE